MPDFAELIGKAVSKINSGFEVAYKDMTDIVNELDVAISKQTEGVVRIGLAIHNNSPEGVVYLLSIVSGRTKRGLGFYKISSAGYPIIPGDFSSRFVQAGVPLNNKEEIESHFAEMLENAESTLVSTLAFLTRKAQG